jgi:sulfur relay (sulfurtransferase) DsrC/TusE family protein
MSNQNTDTKTACEVFAVAIAADRINEGYVKHPQYDSEGKLSKIENKKMVYNHLFRDEQIIVTEEDYKCANLIREHFNGYLMLQLSGKINDFQRAVLKTVQIENFASTNRLEVSIVASLPKVYRSDLERQDLKEKTYQSSHIVEDVFQGNIKVESCRYSQYYDKFRISATVDSKVIDFWYKDILDTGKIYQIKGKVKNRRDDRTTQLNYVKILVDKPGK